MTQVPNELRLQPGEIVRRPGVMTPAERYEAEVQKVTQFHNRAVRNLWDKESPDAE